MDRSRGALNPVRSIFRAVVVTVVPEAERLEETGWLELEKIVERTLHSRSAALQRQLQAFLRVLQWMPVFRFGHRFTAASAQERRRILQYLQDHPVERIRCGFWGLRTLAFLGYYGRPEGAHEIGYVPDPRGWEALR